MKLFFDYSQPAPAGWKKIAWPQDAIELLITGSVKQISFGDAPKFQKRGTPLDVLNWIECAVVERGLIPPKIKIHGKDLKQKNSMLLKAHRIESGFRRLH